MKVDLNSLRGNRRKRGRTPSHDKEILEMISGLNHGEGIAYTEATLYSDEYTAEFAKALPVLSKKFGTEQECEAVFENRWLSRYRQRARSMWETANLPDDEFDFAIFENGEIYIGRK